MRGEHEIALSGRRIIIIIIIAAAVVVVAVVVVFQEPDRRLAAKCSLANQASPAGRPLC